MSTIQCDWKEFKRMVKEFHDATPTLEKDQLDNAWTALALAYLGMSEEIWVDSAAILLKMEAKPYMLRMEQLGCTVELPK